MNFFRTIFLFAACQFLLVGAVQAMPPLHHLVTGVVQGFNPATETLKISPARPGLPDSFRIKEGRTRLRENGQRATLRELSASGQVRIYYKTELGQRVATEVSWRSEKKQNER